MALTIIPGVDFAVDGIPSKLLLERAARDLVVRSIPFNSSLTSVLVGITYADTTGASAGAPLNKGWIWVDNAGHRNVDLRQVSTDQFVRVWSAHGGLETAFLDTRGKTAGAQVTEGNGMWSQHSSADFELWENQLQMTAASNETPRGFAAHLTDSPSSNCRVVLRGMGEVAIGSAGVTETNIARYRPGLTTTAANQLWQAVNQFDNTVEDIAGSVLGRSHGTTGTSKAFGHVAAWFTCRTMGP